MTRGKIVIIYKDFYDKKENIEIMTSIEFNGDMYMPTKQWGGYGQQVINALRRVDDIADYQYEVAKFNRDHHHYNDRYSLTYRHTGDEAIAMLDFSKDYFNYWFSDYIYIKNITGQPVMIKTDEDSKGVVERMLAPDEIAVLNFGSLYKLTK